jgi:hypothetical protein
VAAIYLSSTNEGKQQFYTITPERKLTHPAVLAIASHARAALSG